MAISSTPSPVCPPGITKALFARRRRWMMWEFPCYRYRMVSPGSNQNVLLNRPSEIGSGSGAINSQPVGFHRRGFGKSASVYVVCLLNTLPLQQRKGIHDLIQWGSPTTLLRTSSMPWDYGNVSHAHFVYGTERNDFSFVPLAELDERYTPICDVDETKIDTCSNYARNQTWQQCDTIWTACNSMNIWSLLTIYDLQFTPDLASNYCWFQKAMINIYGSVTRAAGWSTRVWRV